MPWNRNNGYFSQETKVVHFWTSWNEKIMPPGWKKLQKKDASPLHHNELLNIRNLYKVCVKETRTSYNSPIILRAHIHMASGGQGCILSVSRPQDTPLYLSQSYMRLWMGVSMVPGPSHFFRFGPWSHSSFSGWSLVPMRYIDALVPGPN